VARWGTPGLSKSGASGREASECHVVKGLRMKSLRLKLQRQDMSTRIYTMSVEITHAADARA
jgi:hypothetical protein